jgi:hypothetical protein
VLSFDTKHDNQWRGWVTTSDPERPFRSRGPGRYVFRPAWGPPGIAQIAYVCARAFEEGGWHVHADEIYQCAYRPGSVQSYPPELVRLWTAGRSRKVTAWGCTQRPRFLPLFCMSESTHVFVFTLGNSEDGKHLAKMAGVDDLARPLRGEHEFLYYRRRPGGGVRRMVLDV